jgi:hypothetical protein
MYEHILYDGCTHRSREANYGATGDVRLLKLVPCEHLLVFYGVT